LEFFGWAKTAPENRRFDDADVAAKRLTSLFDGVAFEEFQAVFQNWIERLELIRDNRAYFIQ
jgi:hypothetical protein